MSVYALAVINSYTFSGIIIFPNTLKGLKQKLPFPVSFEDKLNCPAAQDAITIELNNHLCFGIRSAHLIQMNV